MKRNYRSILVIAAFVVFNIVETAYFGGNRTAITVAEHICDSISSIGVLFGVVLGMYDWVDYFWSKMTVTVKNLSENEEDKN